MIEVTKLDAIYVTSRNTVALVKASDYSLIRYSCDAGFQSLPINTTSHLIAFINTRFKCVYVSVMS